MKTNILYLLTALLVGLFSSCISEDESSDAILDKDLKEIESFIQNTDIVPVKKVPVGETGIVLLFTEENPGGEPSVSGDSLLVNYTGYFLDGTVFDTSIEQVATDNDMFNSNREYAPYPVILGYTSVISGWHYALSQMKEGEKATALIPSIYAYGPYGQGSIGPNTVLAFDLELVEVIKP